MSNFAASPLELDDGTGRLATFPTVEHYFQACESTRPDERDRIRRLSSPKEAKAAGRTLELRGDWEDIKEAVMLSALRAKFATSPFRERLLATGDRPIIEESRLDVEWGARRTTGGWEGLNRLGLLLMQVRAELRGAEDSKPQLTLPLAE